MNAKDLLTALNDIDPRLLRDVEPWGAPAQPVRRHPILAAAAALVLCLGLGAAGLLLHAFPQLAPWGESQPAIPHTELEFALSSRSTFTTWAAPASGRSLTLEEFAAIWGMDSPAWAGLDLQELLGAYSFEITVNYDEYGDLMSVEFSAHAEKSSTGYADFSVALSPDGYLRNDGTRTTKYAEPNNEVNGVDVRAAESTTYAITDEGELYMPNFNVLLYASEGAPISLAAQAVCKPGGLTEAQAQELLSALVAQTLYGGVDLSPLERTEPLPAIDYLTVTSDMLDNSLQTNDYPGLTLYRGLTKEETAFLADQGFLPKDMDFEFLGGEAGVDNDGNLYYVSLEGIVTVGPEYETYSNAFTITFVPGEIPTSLAWKIFSPLDEPNNTVEGMDVYAARIQGEHRIAQSGEPTYSYIQTDLCLGFLLEGEQPMGVTIHAKVNEWGFPSEEEAQDFAACVLKRLMTKGVSLAGISHEREPEGTYNSPFVLENASDPRTVQAQPPEGFTTRPLEDREIAELMGMGASAVNDSSLFFVADFAGNAVYDKDGNLWQASFTGYQKGTDIEVIHMAFAPGKLPPCCQPGTPPWNNDILGTPVYGACVKEEGQETFSAQMLCGQGADTVGVFCSIVADGDFYPSDDAQMFIYGTMDQLIRVGVDLQPLDINSQPTLSFAENPDPLASTAWGLPPDTTTRSMTEEELSALWGQGLLDSGAPIVTGEVSFNGEDELIRVTVLGFANEEAQAEGMEYFTLHLVPGELPPSDILDRVSFLEEANNRLGGVDVYAARSTTERGQASIVSYYDAAFLVPGSQPMGVAFSAVQGKWGCVTQKAAKNLVERLVLQYLTAGLDLSSLEPPAPSLDIPELGYMENPTVIAQPSWMYPDSRVTLTEKEAAALWGLDSLSWAGLDILEGYTLETLASFDDDGSLCHLTMEAYKDRQAQESHQPAFSLALSHGQVNLPCDAVSSTAPLRQANNTVDGVGIRATRTSESRSYGGSSTSAPAFNVLMLQSESLYGEPENGPVNMAAQAVCEPGGLTEAQAQALLSSLVGQTLADIDLTPLEETSPLRGFSCVDDAFSDAYLRERSLSSGSTYRTEELTEEELLSLWGRDLPWEGFITEDDTLTATADYSLQGDLLRVVVTASRDNPRTFAHEAYQTLSIVLYNRPLSGEWGQTARAALDGADKTLHGTPVAFKETFSTMDYEDGASMDFTSVSAMFVPASGPSLVEVTGLSNPMALTQEQAQDLAGQAVEAILSQGVTLEALE